MRPKATIDDGTGPVGFIVVERQGKAGRRLRAISRRFTVRSAADEFMAIARRAGRDAYVEVVYAGREGKP